MKQRLARLVRVAMPPKLGASVILYLFVKGPDLLKTKKQHLTLEPLVTAIEKKLLGELAKLAPEVYDGLIRMGALCELGSVTNADSAKSWDLQESAESIAKSLGIHV